MCVFLYALQPQYLALLCLCCRQDSYTLDFRFTSGHFTGSSSIRKRRHVEDASCAFCQEWHFFVVWTLMQFDRQQIFFLFGLSIRQFLWQATWETMPLRLSHHSLAVCCGITASDKSWSETHDPVVLSRHVTYCHTEPTHQSTGFAGCCDPNPTLSPLVIWICPPPTPSKQTPFMLNARLIHVSLFKNDQCFSVFFFALIL